MKRYLAARRKDAGSGPVTAILVLGILALLLAAGLTGLGAAAGDEGSSAQHAADAAALGGAQEVLDALPDSLARGFEKPGDIAGLVGGGSCLQTGQVSASQLAAANGASLTNYCWNVFRDEVSVAVRMNKTNVSGPLATAKASAATTFDAPSCQPDAGFPSPAPPPTSSPQPPGGPTVTRPPAVPVDTSVDCGSGALPVTFDAERQRFTFKDLAGDLADVRPRLSS